ncbi:hypothetical protein Sjap_018389 [Stephania japonica]|uniref:Uncharacterized protein n=1 Tax=Stephania japonica TaxID=461633 RepID=A0AAP0I7W5_9MAGN
MKSPTDHGVKTEVTSFDDGKPIGIITESDISVGHSRSKQQPKHGDHDEITNRLKAALEQCVVQGMEEMRQLVHSSCATLKQEMRILFIKALEDFQSKSTSNLIQNYELIDVHVGRLEQHITTHGSDLKREVSQMKMH